MKAKFYISLCFCLITTIGFSQNKSSGYDQLDAYYAQNGYSIEKSKAFTLGEDTTTFNLSFFGGNHYDLSLYSLNDEKLNIQTRLIDGDGKICAEGTNKVGIDLRFIFGKVSYKLLVYAPKSEKGKELMVVQSYKCFNNLTVDHTKNKAHNGYHTLDGVDLIKKFKTNVVKKIEDHLSKALTDLGYKVSKVKVLDIQESKEVFSYVFYKGNDYIIYAMDATGTAEDFKVVEPEKINPFVLDRIEIQKEEKELFRSKDGAVNMTLVDQPKNYSLGVRLAEITNSYGGLSVFVFGYKSKDNSSNDPTKNKSEKAFVN